ncbi:hydrogen peroxide-inducible genes activator [Corynebacterium pseudodiphtheriticum]|uniref:hydrogen peroxide-inducible genes activator n=1 Tax=Corynebacterium pseudodiphtheriticum TaxID=37637 RepID=UPI00234DAB45|nr:hydrogen peroxide-inducible genes activator [Corynebacterium pseudodiphtheriticum]MDC7110055.1 hydrogen peroxide-inducible genes activator [Corynebacterium pseudodiphtheriticum]MDC7113930.1 hydrogen peroxide-inducible genes activator [Corynebacterium pseudodiphtheriticum]
MPNKEFSPTLSQLRTFATVAENRHFGTAATKLGISQPSLSQALVTLEQGLGVQLIERSTRKVIVTAAGKRLLPYALATLQAAELFVTESRGSAGTLEGPLTLGIIPTVAPYILPDVLRATAAEYPNLTLHIVEEQTAHLLQQLRDGQIDVAMLALPTNVPAFVERPLYTENMALVIHDQHELADRSDLTLDALHSVELLLLDDGHCLRDQILELCRLIDRQPQSQNSWVTRAASLTTIMQLVVAHFGATLVPESALDAECRKPGLSVSHFASAVQADRRIGLVYRASSSRGDDFAALGDVLEKAFHQAVERARDLQTLSS